jgi:hypothetical protein
MSHPQPKLEALFNELPQLPHRHKLVVFEYQKNYNGAEKFKDEWLKDRAQEQAQSVPPGRPPLGQAKAHVKDCVADILCSDAEVDAIARQRQLTRGEIKKEIVKNDSKIYGQGFIYRMLTYASGFAHARLVVLERDQASRTFSGHCYGFTMGDANHGNLKEQNSIWVYDENSKFEATGITHLGYTEVLDSGMSLQGKCHGQITECIFTALQVVHSQGPYHLRSNNCEIFCEKLSKLISVESWYNHFHDRRRRNQIEWNDPPEPQPDPHYGFGLEQPQVLPAELLTHSDICLRRANVALIAAAFLMFDQGNMPAGIMMFGTLISTWVFYK